MISHFLQFIKESKSLIRDMRDDGFVHLLMEPLLTYGIGFSLLLFVVAMATKERKCRTLALLLIIVCSVMIYPYQHKRDAGAPRPGYSSYWTKENQKVWDAQTIRRRHFQYVFYALAAIALLNIVISPDSTIGKGLAVMVLGGGVFVLVCGLWLNLHEKRIFYPDLRDSPARGPVTEVWLEIPEQQLG